MKKTRLEYSFLFIDYSVLCSLFFGWLMLVWRIVSDPVNHWGINLKSSLPILLILAVFYSMRILLIRKQRSLHVFGVVVGLLFSIGLIVCLDRYHVLMFYQDWIKAGMPDRAF